MPKVIQTNKGFVTYIPGGKEISEEEMKALIDEAEETPEEDLLEFLDHDFSLAERLKKGGSQ